MKRKTKLFFSLVSLCFSLAFLCFGVYSAMTVSYTVSGSVSYEINDVLVKVELSVYRARSTRPLSASENSQLASAIQSATTLPTSETDVVIPVSEETTVMTYDEITGQIFEPGEDFGYSDLNLTYGSTAEEGKGYAFYIVIDITNYAQETISAQLASNLEASNTNATKTPNVNIAPSTVTDGERVNGTARIVIGLALADATTSIQGEDGKFDYAIQINRGELPVLEEITDFMIFPDMDTKTAAIVAYTGTDTQVEVPDKVGVLYSDTKTMTFENKAQLDQYTSSGMEGMVASYYYAKIKEDGKSQGEQILFANWIQQSSESATYPIEVELIGTTEFGSYEDFQKEPMAVMVLMAQGESIVTGLTSSATIEFNGIGLSETFASRDVISHGIEIIDSSKAFEVLLNIMEGETIDGFESYFPIKVTSTFQTVIKSGGQGEQHPVTTLGASEDIYSMMGIESVFPAGTQSISLSNTLTGIYEGVFDGTDWYTQITSDENFDGTIIASDNITKYYIKAPSTNITSVNLTNVKVIAAGAFNGCSNLSGTIDIPQGQTMIGANTFRDCSLLSQINIPNTVNYVGDYAFYNCTSLLQANISSIVRYVGDYAFYNCTSLSHVNIPAARTIGRRAFYNCKAIKDATSLVIPEGVETIGSDAFDSGLKYTSLSLPTTLKIVQQGAFGDDPRRGALELHIKDLNAFASIDFISGNPRDYGSTNPLRSDSTLFLNGEPVEGAIELEGITKVGEGAFREYSKITSVKLPDTVIEICDYAFYESGLESISIPASVSSIGFFALSWCDSLKEINVDALNANYTSVDGVLFTKDMTELIQYPVADTRTAYSIPSGVKTLKSTAFRNCKTLNQIKIPESLTKIESNNIGFGIWEPFSWCSNVTEVYIQSESIINSLPKELITLLDYIPSEGKIYLKTGLTSSYTTSNCTLDGTEEVDGFTYDVYIKN